MKRIVILLVILAMAVSGIAFADVYTLDEILPSVPSLTDEELQTLYDAVAAERSGRGLAADTEGTAGGEDYVERETVKRGSKGEQAQAVQQRLIELGFLTGIADGDFGKKSEAAVSAFQKANGLKETGIADSETQYVLFSDAVVVKPSLSAAESAAETDPSAEIETAEVDNYVGYNLSSCGYTSWGGDRRDYYGSTTVLLVMVDPDGTYIDPNDEEQLQQYTVVSQWPEAGTEFAIVTSDGSEKQNAGYEEILLIVNKEGETPEQSYEPVPVRPSPGRTIHYVRNYVGRNAETVGYTSWSGDRYDAYGPGGHVKIVIKDENNHKVEDFANLKYCVVTEQNVAPDTEISLTYKKDDPDSVKKQSISTIEIRVAMTDVGKATLEARAEEEEALRASGSLIELYKGDYCVGKDLKAGNYRLMQLGDASYVYFYEDEAARDADNGERKYVYGEDDVEYYALRDGMYLRVKSGAVKAVISELPDGNANEFELYEGVYRVGSDISEGSYEMTQISTSCYVYVYSSEDAFAENDCDRAYLYGKGDTEYYSLKTGMIVRIKDGAVKVTRK